MEKYQGKGGGTYATGSRDINRLYIWKTFSRFFLFS